MNLIDGKKIARKIENQIKKITNPSSLLPLAKGRKGGVGGLAAILVGDNPASWLYVALKEKAAARVGIKFEKILYQVQNSKFKVQKNLENKLINKIQELNKRKDITGIIVQLPLPKNLNTNKIIAAINPKKDVDGFHPKNQKTAVSPVLQAAIEILKNIKSPLPPFYKGGLKGDLSIVLVSNSKIFPIPFQAYFGKNLTVCGFKDIKKYLPAADIIITAIGKKHYLKSGLVKDGAIIIDVGIVREEKKIYGDADPASLAKKTGWLTPVPGGVGPITVACLLKNTIKR